MFASSLGCEPDSSKGILVVLVKPNVEAGELSRLQCWYKLSQAANPVVERAVHQCMELGACQWLATKIEY